MFARKVALAEPFAQAIPHGGRWGAPFKKVAFPLLLGFGLGLAVLRDRHPVAISEPIAMAWQNMLVRAKARPLPLPSVRGSMTPLNAARSYGIGSGPLERLALAAIDANYRDNLVRDVSMQARKSVQDELAELDGRLAKLKKDAKTADEVVKEEVATMDTETKKVVEPMVPKVVQVARSLAGITKPFDASTYALGYFDPIGLSLKVNSGVLLFWREVEVKHGRVAMLATIGIAVGERFHPLFGGDIDVPSYIAFQETPLQAFWPAVVAAIALPESLSILTFEPGKLFQMRSDRMPGDFGFDPLGLKPTTEQELKEMQTKELNNGRLAMIAAAGMLAQELVTGKKLFADNILDSLLSTGNVR